MTLQEDEIVIAGIGGRFPETDNLAELSEKLFAGTDFLSLDPRKLTKGFYEDLPERNGKLTSNTPQFDYTFFGISKAVASAMDTMICQLLERTFEAVIDAGINPSDLRGTDSSVFTGTCHSDCDLEWSSNMKVGYGIMGRNRCMNSNRISYWLDLNGTSYSTDCGWANGMSTLYQGWNAIKSGKSDTAIVGVCSLQNIALPTIQLKDFGVLSPDGITRSFDDSANGWGRSSAVIVLVLQRASIAKRNYATIGHVASTVVGNKNDVISQSTKKDWESMLNEFYEKSKIDVNDIYYVEAHGSGIRDEDAAELNAISEVFCKNRKTPLLVGCVKSNMGHCESSSAFCGLVKAVISMEKGMIPQNLHYEKPNSCCPGLTKGILKVVDKNTPLPPNAWIAVNSHSFGGAYGHVVLKPNLRNKVIKNDGIPRLIPLADRTNDFMTDLFGKVESVSYDPEYIALLQEIYSKKVDRYFGRGYTILSQENPVHESQVYNEEKRPIWFIFSGMGSQWPKMGKRLMDLPLFRESIERSHKILESKGLDLIKIVTDDDPNVFDNILNSFVGIAAVQIALIDILNALNIVPDGLIGHSVGELGCSYADGCFTAEQMILAAYYRGKASKDSDLIHGSMAAVGKQYKDIKDQIPEDVDIACHNSSDNCTLSGPVESINNYVNVLKESGVFAKAVNVSNIAYHSRYIKPAAPILLKYLKEVVPEPKLRSSKWISTSNPEDKWDTDTAKYCSAEYHTNNLLSCVLFQEGSKHIPKNAICIEIAPHGLLQAILKRSLGDEVTNIPLTSRFSADPLIFFLQAIGKIYMTGVDVKIMNLYPKIEFPVSRGTPFLSNLPHWHEQKLNPLITPMGSKVVPDKIRRLVSGAADGMGLIVNGKNKYPLSIFVDLLWELFASQNKQNSEECPILIQKFKLSNFVDIHLSEDDNKVIYFLNGSGDFEIVESDQYLCSGNISVLKEKPFTANIKTLAKPDLLRNEIYAELKRKGYTFGDSYKSLLAVSFGENEMLAEIPAKSTWNHTIESMIQLHLLHTEESPDFLYAPFSFDELEISSLMHIQHRNSLNENSNLVLAYDFVTNTVTCGGLTLKRLKYCLIPRAKSNLSFKQTTFFPYLNPPLQNIMRFADFCFGIVMDNLDSAKKLFGFNILEVVDKQRSTSIGSHLQELHPDVKMKVGTVTNADINTKNEGTMEFAITPASSLDGCMKFVVDGGFVLVRTTSNLKIPVNLKVVTRFVDDLKHEYLLLKKGKVISEEYEFVKIDEDAEGILKELKPSPKVRYLVMNKNPLQGIEEFRARIQAKTSVPLRWIFILDSSAPPFNPEESLYCEQLKKGLLMNVFSNGSWGSFYNYTFVDGSGINFNLEESNELKPSYISFDPEESLTELQQVEFSGKLNGTRVMGISKLQYHRKIVVDKNLTWELPESWNFEEGATVPLHYCLAYYCLVILGEMKPQKKVLVTDAMSCVGQAHVAVALSLGCKVFVTVPSEKEVVSIKKLFPQLEANAILNHNQPKYDVAWKLDSSKYTMDLIINMLDGEAFFSILPLLGEFGVLCHYGKEDLRKNSQLGTYMFLMTMSFYAVGSEIVTRLPESDKTTLHELMKNGIKNGVLRPLPRLTSTIKQVEKLQSTKGFTAQMRVKTLLQIENTKSNFIKFNSSNSYVVLGDETDLWVNVVEWLLNRKVTNIVVGRRDKTKRGHFRAAAMKTCQNVFISDHQNVDRLLSEAKKLGTLSAVFYISTNSAEENEIITSLDKLYRDPNSHFFAISTCQGFLSEKCAQRNKSGFPSTNFIWKADVTDIDGYFESMAKLCGRDSIIHVTPPALLSTVDHRLSDLLPNSIDDFCAIGSSLQEHVEIVPLNTLAGSNTEDYREITPFIMVPGLKSEPVEMLQPFVANFLYPTAYVKIPDMNLSIKQMVTFILPEIVKFNKSDYYNIIGISWGSHLAMELTRQLEEIGATVGLILIEGPVQNVKSLVTKSLEWDLLNLIQGKFKTATDFKVENEALSELSWKGQLNTVLNALNLPADKEKDFCKGAMFIYNNIKALLEHDISSTKFAGPFTVIVSGQHNFDDKLISQFCKYISIRSLPTTSEDLLNSRELWSIIHGSAISQPMSKNTVHECTWPALEEYISQKEKATTYQNISSCNLKFSFSC
ncbi:hypothetical protein RUM43_010521 [Polyplax serrata]|uniref:Fatty acid synthase n=1 Tax=Polyplax serrata TaxID=468196 RepID=A0AAN8PKY4_POLSC